jgi:ribosomal protein S18 acetylase RimI-like enzyme
MLSNNKVIRPYQNEDESAVIGVWHRSGLAAYPYLPTFQALTWEKAQQVFRDVIRPKNTIWVGTDDDRVVAYLAINESYIDRLYVDPAAQHQGWGTRFIAFAKEIRPKGLELHTHVENHPARKLYEKHGFVVVKFGISPPPESAPDVEYHWRPV